MYCERSGTLGNRQKLSDETLGFRPLAVHQRRDAAQINHEMQMPSRST